MVNVNFSTINRALPSKHVDWQNKMLCAIRSVYRGQTHNARTSFGLNLAALCLPNHNLAARETLMETTVINYDLLPKSSMNISFNTLITMLGCQCR